MSKRMATPPVSGTGSFSLTRLVRLLLALGVGVALVLVALDLPEEPGGLTGEVSERMEDSGVSHPVTAVLLNFRAYDTFLEVGVLVLAVLGVMAVRRESDLRSSARMVASPLFSDPVLGWLVRLLAPVLVLAGGYLLWLGSFAPGGAFQAGAMLAGAGVALRMSGHPSISLLSRGWLRVLLLAGFIVFLIVAAGTMLFLGNLLEMPNRGAGLLILVIETFLTVSIAVTLATLFVGAKSPYQGDGDDAGPEQAG